MTRAVNLLPESCHNLRRRLVRRNAWTVVVACAGLLLAGAWLVLRVSDHVIVRSSRELEAVQVRQSELDCQLALATITRNDLAERGRALSALRHEHSLPEQLLTLSEQAPDGVVFTEIRAAAALGRERSPRYRSHSPQAGPADAPAGTPRPETPSLLVRIHGYAIDHTELTRLIDVLQSATRGPWWEQVELLRAAREPYGRGEALAFQLECRPAEDNP